MDTRINVNNSTITVSIVVVTYNHRRYIAQCLDSILAQKTAFAYEILIGEDDSKDGTREICRKYAEQYPDRIRLFLNDRKNVIYIDGRPTGRWNFINLLNHAKGKYIALCEGDDSWTSPDKLQKQIDYLDTHPESAACFHNVNVVYENNSKEGHPFLTAKITEKKNVFTLEDIVSKFFIPTCSVVFRNGLFGDFPEWYFTIPMGDWPLHVLNAEHGNFYYLEEILATYRVHEQGMWSGRKRMEVLSKTMQAVNVVNRYLNFKFDKKIKANISLWHFEATQILSQEGNTKGTFYHAFKSLITSPFSHRELKALLPLYLLQCALPRPYAFLKRILGR